VLAVELRPDPEKEQRPISNRTVLETIRPLLAQLRLPADYAAHLGRDRLRWLEIDECVFLPAEGLLRREEAPYHPQAFEDHRARAVEEGAEKRRHFLRVRVGGWEEELVVHGVRAHPTPRAALLTLEIAPHVLLPVREDFKNADRTAHRFRHKQRARQGGLGARPGARLPRRLRRRPRPERDLRLAAAHRRVRGARWPDGPALSVREFGGRADRVPRSRRWTSSGICATCRTGSPTG